MHLKNLTNGYMDALGHDLFDKTPKSVFAAVAVSMLTTGGDYLEQAREAFLHEWEILHLNGIVQQKPPKMAKAEEQS